MPKAPPEIATPESLGGLDIDDLLSGEVEVEDEPCESISSLADRAEDSLEDMNEKLEVALPIEQEQRDALDARDEEELEDLDIEGSTDEVE